MGVDAMMFVGLKEKMGPLAVRRISADMAEAFGAERFFITLPSEAPDSFNRKPRHALEIMSKSEAQESEAFSGRPEVRQWLTVNLWGRYYGDGYERGDLPFLYCLGRWLEIRFPGSVLLYGGDCDGDYQDFSAGSRDALFAHFARVGHKPYNGGFSSMVKGERQTCEFCAGIPMNNYGGGQGQEFYRCDGCGFKGIRENGVLREIEGEFFERKYKDAKTKAQSEA